MIDSFMVVIWLIIHGLICIAFNFLNIPSQLRELTLLIRPTRNLLSLRIVIVSFVAYLILLAVSLLSAKWSVQSAFIVLFAIPTTWIAISLRSVRARLVTIFIGVTFLLLWLFSDKNALIQNIFLIWSTSWIGAVLTHTKILTIRRFVVFSLVWMIYDMVFVWVTPASDMLLTIPKVTSLPLWIRWGRSGIGSGDLIYMSMLLAVVGSRYTRFITLFALSIVSLIIYIYSYMTGSIFSFPLLVVWVPVGFILLRYTNQQRYHKIL